LRNAEALDAIRFSFIDEFSLVETTQKVLARELLVLDASRFGQSGSGRVVRVAVLRHEPYRPYALLAGPLVDVLEDVPVDGLHMGVASVAPSVFLKTFVPGMK
jgi:hypothetical protein